MYTENPKTKGSGIIACIPQKGICPNKCEDCFFQSGRSYLEPLEDNLPNMPSELQARNRVVRINDGNDSNIGYAEWVKDTKKYPMKFYNTAIPKNLDGFDAPVVLTVNPGKITDKDFYRVESSNLMFVRARTNMWNLPLISRIVEYYGDREVSIVLTFMAYFTTAVPPKFRHHYIFRKRTLNSYWAIKTSSWRKVMKRWIDTPYEKWVYSCGKIEGEQGTSACRHCGNCLREYFAAMAKRTS